jgi:phage anti-repressor protein
MNQLNRLHASNNNFSPFYVPFFFVKEEESFITFQLEMTRRVMMMMRIDKGVEMRKFLEAEEFHKREMINCE